MTVACSPTFHGGEKKGKSEKGTFIVISIRNLATLMWAR